MRIFRLVVAVLLLAACTPGQTVVSSSSRITPLSDSKAADLRLRMNLLLSEQVMIVAKESEAAAFETRALVGYAHLLDINGGELALVIRNAYGNRSAEEFQATWQVLNRDLVEYGTGLVTHNQSMSDTFGAELTTSFVPRMTLVASGLTDLDPALLTQLLTQQVTATKLVIEDVAGSKFSNLYADLHTAYASTSRFGDALAKRIAQKFPDKFPGDPSNTEVDLRVALANLLQEHSYIATMATNAAVGKRDAESGAAAGALAANVAALEGFAPGRALWKARDDATLAYAASGDASAMHSLTQTFITSFALATGISNTTIGEQVAATIKVVDDQRGQSFKTLADDDRAAATTMQPISDAIAFNPKLRR